MRKVQSKLVALLAVVAISATMLAGCEQGFDSKLATGSAKNGSGNTSIAARHADALVDGIQSDINNLQVSLDGNLYRLPLNFQELAAKGYDALMLNGTDMEADSTVENAEILNSSVKATVTIKNPSSAVINYKDGNVNKFSVSPTNFWDASSPSVQLIGGIELGKATKTDVITLYGEPTTTSEDKTESSICIEYSKFANVEPGGEYSLKLWFDEQTEVLVGVSIIAQPELQ